ncbi:phosphate ABC transporter substrate-binding protein PstS [Microbulbifer sp. HZ11]|uniref:phosphate ABC transporter substrate-binding protein PstS n=1 Tax=Microbulbifer sp. HZ11 TaxID=1453501 RepID=UPI00069043CF|nr:phosphate ABC transporter substrate-binding protein PstS [Microbulbifer sp. HZ11]
MNERGKVAPNRTLRLILLMAFLAVLIAAGISLFKDISQGRHDDDMDGRARVVGAGASFPAPLYERWFKELYSRDQKYQVDYQSVGSAAGITNFLQGRVDFAGSDYPLEDASTARLDGGVLQLPMAAGAIVFIYNLEGVAELKLSRDVLAKILLGEIRRWNDPQVQKNNPEADLPDQKITLVARAEASGTTLHMSRHIEAYSKSFAERIGASKDPQWPSELKESGSLIRARGNAGIARMVGSVPGAIGYVQYAYAENSKLPMALLENRAGNMVAPGPASFQSALVSFEGRLTRQNIADPEGVNGYPIISFSWLIMRKSYRNPDVYPVMSAMIHYGLGEGQEVVEEMGYIPFPESGRRKLLEYFDSRGASGPLPQPQ